MGKRSSGINREIIRLDEDGLHSFVGDDFDNLYAKYYFRSRGLNVTGVGDDVYETLEAVGMRLGTIVIDALESRPRTILLQTEAIQSDFPQLDEWGHMMIYPSKDTDDFDFSGGDWEAILKENYQTATRLKADLKYLHIAFNMHFKSHDVILPARLEESIQRINKSMNHLGLKLVFSIESEPDITQ